MKHLLIALAVASTPAMAEEKAPFYDPSFVIKQMPKSYIKKQMNAMKDCRLAKTWANSQNAKAPIKLSPWAWLQSTEAACIDLVIEDQVRVDEDALPAGVKFEGRYVSELRRAVHKEICGTPFLAKGWEIHIKYVTRFDRQLALTEISQKSCKSYQFKKEKAKI